jgi:Na+-driven multidrug efflux pump
VFWSLGSAISIMVGQMLGAGKLDEARTTAYKLIYAATASCVVVGGLLFASSGFFPSFFNTTDIARQIARNIIRVSAVAMPLNAFMHCCYFTLRSGGKTIITFIFDSFMVWIMSIPIAFVLSRYTDLSIVLIVVCVTAADMVKCVLGFILVKKGVWVQNIIN